MSQNIKVSRPNKNKSFEQEISELTQEKILFTEKIYANIPIGIEIYDTQGILRYINDHALKMYGVNDPATVIGIVNLFKSPYVDEKLKAKIQSGEDIKLEFEYDFNCINENSYYPSINQDSMIYEVKVVTIWNKEKNIIGHMLLTNNHKDIYKMKTSSK